MGKQMKDGDASVGMGGVLFRKHLRDIYTLIVHELLALAFAAPFLFRVVKQTLLPPVPDFPACVRNNS